MNDDYTALQAANALGCSDDTILNMLKKGTLTGYRVGAGRGHHRIHRASVERLLQKHEPPLPGVQKFDQLAGQKPDDNPPTRQTSRAKEGFQPGFRHLQIPGENP